MADFPPRYNIAPTQPILMLLAAPPAEPGSNRPAIKALLVRWGLIPSWVKNPKDFPLLINARSETAAEKNSFRAAMRHRRAVIPASGFYEWKRDGGKQSQPFWVRPRHGGIVLFAGLMETWCAPDGSEIDTGAVITTSANDEIAKIHDRMPVVIKPEDLTDWLNCRDKRPEAVAHLLTPAEPGFFEAIPISTKVNKVSNTGPEILDPVSLEEEPALPQSATRGQMSLL